jgi:hypothetical protein
MIPFDYSTTPHVRRHGPVGYDDYRLFKPWLRDEFTFCCAYCLTRERWRHDGDGTFCVDHEIPRSVDPSLTCRYDNLIYACHRCNSIRQDQVVLNPCSVAIATHVRVGDDGLMIGLTTAGSAHIRILRLNNSRLVEYRARMIATVRRLSSSLDAEDQSLLHLWLGFPDNLPNLAILRPPGGNTRPAGVGKCHYQRRIAGELPDSH